MDGLQHMHIPAGQTYTSPGCAYIEGDASSASYFLAGATITGGTITVEAPPTPVPPQTPAASKHPVVHSGTTAGLLHGSGLGLQTMACRLEPSLQERVGNF